jgi:hypothetical protein
MQLFFVEKLNKNSLILLCVAFMGAMLVLATSLSLATAIIAFVFGCALVIFESSFSRGWLFLLSVIMLSPQMKISGTAVLVNDLLLFSLSLVGLVKLAISDDYRFKKGGLSNYFFGLIFLTSFMILLSNLFGRPVENQMLIIGGSLILIWTVMEAFRYYFQTKKRIERFLAIVFIVGTIHSIFGLLMLIFGWQTSMVVGISSIKSESLIFGDIKFQLNGLFGLGLSERVKTNVLAPFLLLSIPIGIGFLKKELLKRKLNSESLSIVQKNDYWRKTVSFFKSFSKREWLLLMALAVQLLALLFTHSYLSLLFLFFGLFIMAILDRDRKLIAASMVLLLLLSVVIPSIKSPQDIIPVAGASEGFRKLISYSSNWFLGENFSNKSVHDKELLEASGSYLQIWKTLGIAGLVLALSMVYIYFKDLFLIYKKSDGTERIWLISILGAFAAYFPETFFGNVLFFGPSALIFWLLYGTAKNLSKKETIFGITESRLTSNE